MHNPHVRPWGVFILLLGLPAGGISAEKETTDFAAVPVAGKAEFVPGKSEESVPKRYQQARHDFSFETEFERDSGPVRVFKVRFPSPVKTDVEINNTVHAQYFQPQGPGPFPGVVVLHILGGDFPLSQMISNGLARRGVAALFVKLPYYGERRPKDSRKRMLSPDLDETVAGMTQAVLDVRRAATWLENRPELDGQQLGVMGISLGGIMSGLSAAVEPRFQKVAMYLAGGNLHSAIWDSRISEIQRYQDQWKAAGETRESFIKKMADVDPVTHAHLLKNREILMVNAQNDEVIPKDCTMALWNAIGTRREIVWLDAGHYSAALHIVGEMERMVTFFQPNEASEGDKETGR
jgi:dienelactone hydrolase